MTPFNRQLHILHTEVDTESARLRNNPALSGKLQCRRGCTDCCIDDLTVFTIEAERIRIEHPEVLKEKPGPLGQCAFLNGSGACRIYSARPYVCRTQGLPLRWFEAHTENDEDDFADLLLDISAEAEHELGLAPLSNMEHRDICPLNDTGTISPSSLKHDECWLLGPFEDQLQQLEIHRAKIAHKEATAHDPEGRSLWRTKDGAVGDLARGPENSSPFERRSLRSLFENEI